MSVELYAWGKKVTADNFHYTGETLPETKDWAISPGKYQNFKNSQGNISNSKFLSGWLKLPIHTGKVENPNLFHRGLIL